MHLESTLAQVVRQPGDRCPAPHRLADDLHVRRVELPVGRADQFTAHHDVPDDGHQQQQFQQRVLGTGQLDAPVAAPRHAGLRVQRQVGVRQRPGGTGRYPAQQRAEAGQQLVRGERLDEVVVGAGVESGHPVGDRVAGGQHQDRGTVAAGP